MLSTRGPMSINRPGPSAGRGPMPSHQTGPSAGRGPMTSHHTGPWASRGPHSLHSAASRGMGAEHRGHGMQQDLLDKERKEELILAKQVRQGTVVIRGNSQMKVSIQLKVTGHSKIYFFVGFPASVQDFFVI